MHQGSKGSAFKGRHRDDDPKSERPNEGSTSSEPTQNGSSCNKGGRGAQKGRHQHDDRIKGGPHPNDPTKGRHHPNDPTKGRHHLSRPK
eukprot:259969-Pleurochrysis_carterae.AAC.1